MMKLGRAIALDEAGNVLIEGGPPERLLRDILIGGQFTQVDGVARPGLVIPVPLLIWRTGLLSQSAVPRAQNSPNEGQAGAGCVLARHWSTTM
ncbi:MAG: hypothetical protein U1G07_14440 [Verrucomicrobiota bacterium]